MLPRATDVNCALLGLRTNEFGASFSLLHFLIQTKRMEMKIRKGESADFGVNFIKESDTMRKLEVTYGDPCKVCTCPFSCFHVAKCLTLICRFVNDKFYINFALVGDEHCSYIKETEFTLWMAAFV